MSNNLSQDIIKFCSVLVDKLRAEWIVTNIDITNVQEPKIDHEILDDFSISEDEVVELGYWNFVSGTGFEWIVVLRNKALEVSSNVFKIKNELEVDLSQVTTVRNIVPYFYHGTYIDVNKELDTSEEVLSTALYPAVILWEVIRQNFEADHTSILGNTPKLTLSFLDTTNKLDWTNDEQYSKVVDPMEALADKFIKICDKHPYLAKLENYTYIKHTNWGKVVQDKGHVKYLLDENLAGLNLEIDLPIKKACLNKFAKL